MDEYYKDAYTKDRLSNLTDKELLYTLRETPNKIKKACKTLLKVLDENGVKIDAEGNVDYSEVQNQGLKARLEKDSLVKYALLQRETGYGFTHLDTMKKQGAEVRREIMGLKSYDAKKEEEETREERELLLKKQASQTQIDQTIGFTASGGYTSTKDRDAAGLQRFQASDLIIGTQYRLDNKGLLVESFAERLARLEKRWIYERMSNTEGGLDAMDPEEASKRFEELTKKVRRVKIQLERAALGEAKGRIFEEHERLTNQQLLVESTPIERLLNYYALPVDQRQSGLLEDFEFQTAKDLVKRKEIVEDLANPYEATPQAQFSDADLELQNKKTLRRVQVDREQERQERKLGSDIDKEKSQEMSAEAFKETLSSKKGGPRKLKESKHQEAAISKLREKKLQSMKVRENLGFGVAEKDKQFLESTKNKSMNDVREERMAQAGKQKQKLAEEDKKKKKAK